MGIIGLFSSVHLSVSLFIILHLSFSGSTPVSLSLSPSTELVTLDGGDWWGFYRERRKYNKHEMLQWCQHLSRATDFIRTLQPEVKSRSTKVGSFIYSIIILSLKILKPFMIAFDRLF